MWNLKLLLNYCEDNHVYLNGKWVPSRPLNGQKNIYPFWKRIKDSWKVFKCKAEAFEWPEGQ